MKLLSVNVSAPKQMLWRGRPVRTGFFKEPVAGPVRITRQRVQGDVRVDLDAHGGLDNAVYAYPHEHYAHWGEFLGLDAMAYGYLGENLTLEGLLEDALHVGDVLRVGSAVLQIAKPRQPCFKLAGRMNRPDFPKVFEESGRVGFYLRVLEEGEVEAGNPIERAAADPRKVSVREMMGLMRGREPDPAMLRRALQIESLSQKLRVRFKRMLAGRPGELEG